MENVITGALVTVIVVMSKMIELLIEWYRSKDESEAPRAALHPEVSRQIRETYEGVTAIGKDLESVVKVSHTSLELIQQITDAMKAISASQEKTAALLDKVDRRLEIQEAVDLAAKKSA